MLKVYPLRFKAAITVSFLLVIYACSKKDTPAGNTGTTTPVTTTPPVTTATTYKHPGIINTEATLNFVAADANNGTPARTSAYQKILDYINSHTYPTTFPSTVVVGSNGATTPSKNQIRSDSELSYALALCWARTGDITYANKAIFILNGWSRAFTNYTLIDNTQNQNQPGLEASWTTPTFVAAAEIIRYYKVNGKAAGWADADISQFNNYLGLTMNYINYVPLLGYNNNWNVSAGYAKMAIGIFLENPTVYQAGVKIINDVFTKVIQSDGTCPELCDRQDCVHYQYSLTGIAYAAEIAHIQGDDAIYDNLAKRLSAGYDFMRTAYGQGTGCNYCSTSSPVFPGTEIAYRHYKTANLKYLRDLGGPNGVPSDNTFLGFTTYTHYGVD